MPTGIKIISMKFKDSKLKLYFDNNGTMMILKNNFQKTYKLVEKLYPEIREKYIELNPTHTDPIVQAVKSLFAKPVHIYLSDDQYDQIKTDLKLKSSNNEIKFGFSTRQTLFTIGNQTARKANARLNNNEFNYTGELC